jgi:hypothetical protein
MAFKTKRQNRYEYLREHGFMPFEAKTLSVRPLKLPYIKEMIRDRMQIVKQSNKENWTQKQFRATIYQLYNVRGWKMAGSARNSAWAMSHYYEDINQAKHPDYKSPAPKRKDHIADVRKFAK